MSVVPRVKPRVVGVLPQETRLRIANERKARHAHPSAGKSLSIRQLCACKADAGRRLVGFASPRQTREARPVGRSRSSQDFPNTHPLRCLTKLLSINAVPIAQQIARGMVPRECLQKLTGCPFCCGVRGHSEMKRTSAVMVENHKDE
jgi:hypothetical protein